MADYIYLLDNRLSPAQRNALRIVRDLARSKNLTVFLVGGAVRDLTSGSPVRDLDVAVQGSALKLKADLEKAGAVVVGELTHAQALFLDFPGSVRMEISSTLSVTWPKPGRPVFKPASILDDLRRRDFTANAMALSLNEGSYGLLMDPLNGVADIENRELRLVSNYGFIEDPVRMVRAARLMARLGWTLDEKTQQRYETGKHENYIAALSDLQRGYETEEIVHEEDPMRVLTRLESEGWLLYLAPFWTPAKADAQALEHLREVQTQLQIQGIHPDPSAANFPLLTARLTAREVATLKAGFVRQGFVKEVEALDRKGKELIGLLNSKEAALPSQTWKIITSAAPEVVLWVAYSSKSPAIQAKFKSFFTVWPQTRQKMPHTILQEMRITPELPGYDEVLEKLFFEFLDDKLQTSEEIRAFLEPFSPPAPPPPVNTRRVRAPKKDAKGKGRGKKALAVEADPDLDPDEEMETDEAADSENEDDPVSSELDLVLAEALDEEVVEADEVSPDDVAESVTAAETKASSEHRDSPPPLAKEAGKRSKEVSPATPVEAERGVPAEDAAKPSAPRPSAVRPSVRGKADAKATPAPTMKLAAAKKAVAKKAVAEKPAGSAPSPSRRALAASQSTASAPPRPMKTPPAKHGKTPAKQAAGKAVPPARPASGKSAAAASGKSSRAMPPANAKAKPPSKATKTPPKAPAKQAMPAKSPQKKQTPPAKSASKKAVAAKKRR